MYEKGKGLSDAAHKQLNAEYRKYIAIGGMPLVVNEYIESNGNYLKCHKIKSDICKLYKDDLHKHDLLYGTNCEKVWDLIPSMLRNESTRFIIGLNGNRARYSTQEKTFGDIVDSKTAIMVNKLVEPTPGNEIAMSEGQFRLYACDSGLLVTSIYKEQNATIEEIYKKIILDDSDVNLGSAYESIIAQTLLSNGYKPYYHKYEIKTKNEKGQDKINKYEIDFMVEHSGKTLAIEVKSGRNFTISSLDNLKKKYSSYKFKKIVISGKQYKRASDTLYLPIYMSFCL